MAMTTCPDCAGTGDCTECGGTGKVGGATCPECDGTGKCAECDGSGGYHYTVGTFADGAHSDGQNFREYCGTCEGRGSVEDVL